MALRFSSTKTALFSALLCFFLFSAANRATSFLLLYPDRQQRRLVQQNPDPGTYLQKLLARRRLAGPGSSPPTCRSKCGRCSPCKAVHVPIQPGRSVPLEYYPEAWRCKCGNHLFMP